MGTSAATWAAEARKASSVRVETSCDVEILCRDLALQCSTLEVELEAKRREAEEKSMIERLIATVEEQIHVARATRLDAVKAVQGLTRMSVDEVKAMKNRPPRIVRRALEAVYTVLNCQRWLEGMRGFDVTKEWNRIQKMLANDGFVQSVLQFNVAGLDVVPHVVDFLVERYFPSLPHDVEACQSPRAPCQPKATVKERFPAPSTDEFVNAKIQQQSDLASIDMPLPPIKGPLPATLDSARRKIFGRPRTPLLIDSMPLSQLNATSTDLPLRPISVAMLTSGSDSARRKAASEVCAEACLSNVAALAPEIDATSSELPLPPIALTIAAAGNEPARRGVTSRGRSPIGVGEALPTEASSAAQQVIDSPLPPVIAIGKDSARRGGLAETRPAATASDGAALTEIARTPIEVASGNNLRRSSQSTTGHKSNRPGALTNIASMKRFEKAKGRKASLSSEVIEEPLDIAAVEYASRACGAMVRWVYEVLREFLALRALRVQKGSLLRQLGEEYKRTQEAVVQLQEEVKRIREELDTWKRRLTEMKTKEAETEYARSALAKLSRLEERQCAVALAPFEKISVGASASGLLRTNRGGKLRPVQPLSDAATPLVSRGGPVARHKSMMDLQPHSEKAQNSDAAWPPKGRNYLHVMSTPMLSTRAFDDEATE